MSTPFPFGTPVNRPAPKPELAPIAGRPNWFKDKAGTERYVDPVKSTDWGAL